MNIIKESELTAGDVLLGRGDHSVCHEGNVQFRKLIVQYKDAYSAATRNRDKDFIAHSIINMIEGKFLRKATSEEMKLYVIPKGINAWVPEDNTERLLKKVKQGFRDAEKPSSGSRRLGASPRGIKKFSNSTISNGMETLPNPSPQVALNVGNAGALDVIRQRAYLGALRLQEEQKIRQETAMNNALALVALEEQKMRRQQEVALLLMMENRRQQQINALIREQPAAALPALPSPASAAPPPRVTGSLLPPPSHDFAGSLLPLSNSHPSTLGPRELILQNLLIKKNGNNFFG